MKNYFKYFSSFFLIGFLFFENINGAIAVGITLGLLFYIFHFSNEVFAFRELALFLYALNYLLSPAITYIIDDSFVTYPMKINSDYYFSLAIPGFICFAIGLYFFKTHIFRINFDSIKKSTVLNEVLLKRILIISLFISQITKNVPGDLQFIFYLISLLRYIAAFALLLTNYKKYWIWVLIVYLIEMIIAFRAALFHDFLIWLIFFSLFITYQLKFATIKKILGAVSVVIFILFIQSIKSVYRDFVWRDGGEASISNAVLISSNHVGGDVLVGNDNLLATLTRSNQAWIFASTVENINRTNNYQGLAILGKYLESSLLPRFLAPDKLKSGDRTIFNSFSGHYLQEGTAMGLGVFADGYIAYGAWGVYTFGFFLGVLFSATFKIVEHWMKISNFYLLLILPLLSYAIRPDCELQTTVNHLTKGLLLYGLFVTLSKYRFSVITHSVGRKWAS
jgi:hypothetical protein